MTEPNNLEETIAGSASPQICVDNFDEYVEQEWKCHWHPEIEIGIVLNGTVEFTLYDEGKQKYFYLQEGDGIFISDECLHSAKALEKDTKIVEVVFSPHIFDGCFWDYSFKKEIESSLTFNSRFLFFSHLDKDNDAILSSLKELCKIDRSEECYSLHLVEGICRVSRELTPFMDKTQKKPVINIRNENKVKELISYMHEHYSEHISVEELSSLIGVSRTECFRCFKSVVGESPIEYLIEYRLRVACSLLKENQYTVNQIALMCGFENPSYFGKIFKERFGISPKKYYLNNSKRNFNSIPHEKG